MILLNYDEVIVELRMCGESIRCLCNSILLNDCCWWIVPFIFFVILLLWRLLLKLWWGEGWFKLFLLIPISAFVIVVRYWWKKLLKVLLSATWWVPVIGGVLLLIRCWCIVVLLSMFCYWLMEGRWYRCSLRRRKWNVCAGLYCLGDFCYGNLTFIFILWCVQLLLLFCYWSMWFYWPCCYYCCSVLNIPLLLEAIGDTDWTIVDTSDRGSYGIEEKKWCYDDCWVW